MFTMTGVHHFGYSPCGYSLFRMFTMRIFTISDVRHADIHYFGCSPCRMCKKKRTSAYIPVPKSFQSKQYGLKSAETVAVRCSSDTISCSSVHAQFHVPQVTGNRRPWHYGKHRRPPGCSQDLCGPDRARNRSLLCLLCLRSPVQGPVVRL